MVWWIGRMNKLNPPYKTISEKLFQGQVVPFLGSGASLCPRQPVKAPWYREELQENQWTVSYIPTARELAVFLADRATFPPHEPIDLTKVAQYYNVVNGRGLLHQTLHKIFDCNHPYNTLHIYLARVTAPLLIVTTNYDDLIERAFREVGGGQLFDLVVHTTDPDAGGELLWWPHDRAGTGPERVLAKDLDIDLKKVSVIYKMHGAVDRAQQQYEQYVITEDDYIDFLRG